LHRSPLDVDQMHAVGQVLVGKHDFASFQATGSTTPTTVRRLFRLSVSRVSTGQLLAESGGAGGIIAIEVRGNGFLRHMVRVIVGTLVEVGLGRRSKADVERALRVGAREAAGPTAPPQGLFLTRVEYG
jgi:tRNA pseudouridine38-40 synthase